MTDGHAGSVKINQYMNVYKTFSGFKERYIFGSFITVGWILSL